MIRLQPMTEREFTAFCNWMIPEYAAEHVRAGNWSQEESLGRAREEFEKILPSGLSTADQFLWTVRSEPNGERVGDLWCALRPEGGTQMLWIYWIGIDEAHRRHGYAARVLRLLDGEARRRGAARLGLHVFGSNSGALALYEKLGFAPTNIVMAKIVPQPASERPAPERGSAAETV